MGAAFERGVIALAAGLEACGEGAATGVGV